MQSVALPWNRTFFTGVTSANPQMDQLLQQEPLPPQERRHALFERTWRQVAYVAAIVAAACFAALGTVAAGSIVLFSHPLFLPLTIPVALAALVGVFFCAVAIKDTIQKHLEPPIEMAKQRAKRAELILTAFNQTPPDTVGLKNYITTNSIASTPAQADQILQKFDQNLDRLRIAIAHYLDAQERARSSTAPVDKKAIAHLEGAFWLAVIRRGGEPMSRKEGRITFVEAPVAKNETRHQTFARIDRTEYDTAEDILNKTLEDLTKKLVIAMGTA